MDYTEMLGGMGRYYGEGRTQSFEVRRKSLERLEQGLKKWGKRLEQVGSFKAAAMASRAERVSYRPPKGPKYRALSFSCRFTRENRG